MKTHDHLAQKVIQRIKNRKNNRRKFLLLGLGIGASLAGLRFFTESEPRSEGPLFSYHQIEGPSLVYFEVKDNGF